MTLVIFLICALIYGGLTLFFNHPMGVLAGIIGFSGVLAFVCNALIVSNILMNLFGIYFTDDCLNWIIMLIVAGIEVFIIICITQRRERRRLRKNTIESNIGRVDAKYYIDGYEQLNNCRGFGIAIAVGGVNLCILMVMLFLMKSMSLCDAGDVATAIASMVMGVLLLLFGWAFASEEHTTEDYICAGKSGKFYGTHNYPQFYGYKIEPDIEKVNQSLLTATGGYIYMDGWIGEGYNADGVIENMYVPIIDDDPKYDICPCLIPLMSKRYKKYKALEDEWKADLRRRRRETERYYEERRQKT